MEKGSNVTPLVFKSSAGGPEGGTISRVLTDAEVATILSACSTAGLKTEEEQHWVLRECEKMRIGGVMLNLLLKGKILPAVVTEGTVYFQPNLASKESKQYKEYLEAQKNADPDGQA